MGQNSMEELPAFFYGEDAVTIDFLAAVEVELFGAKGCGLKFMMTFDELTHCFGRSLVDAGDGQMRVVDAAFGFNADTKKAIFDAFM